MGGRDGNDTRDISNSTSNSNHHKEKQSHSTSSKQIQQRSKVYTKNAMG